MHRHCGTGKIELVPVIFHHEFEYTEHVPSFKAVFQRNNLLCFITVELHVTLTQGLGYFFHAHL